MIYTTLDAIYNYFNIKEVINTFYGPAREAPENIKQLIETKSQDIFYMSQEQLDNQIKNLKKIEPVKKQNNLFLNEINLINPEQILSSKKNSSKIHLDESLSLEERRNKINDFFKTKKKEREYELEMNRILNCPKLRRENKEKVLLYLSSKQ